MRLAVMQPYIFPYLGYYQLAAAVDKFIFFDDVHFINKGWINRNNILQQNNSSRFTIPLIKASQNRLINDIEIADFSKWRKDFLKQVEFNYRKARCFSNIFPWLQNFLFSKEYRLISDLASNSVMSVMQLLGLPTQFEFSSNLDYRDGQVRDGQDKILKICAMMNADHYINPKNGTELYDPAHFKDRHITLNFICMDDIIYDQFSKGQFVPFLSIIDVLMFNDVEATRSLLKKYTLN
jgi:hypothetical protein